MKIDHHTDDLLVLARRGDLPDGDARRLRDSLAGSEEARLLYEAGRAFDREAPVLAGDDERIEQIARAVQRRMRPERGVRRAWAVRLCVAVALIAGVAIGAGELRRSWQPVEPVPPRSGAVEVLPAMGPPGTGAVPPPAEVSATPAATAAPAAPAPSPAPRTAATPHHAPPHSTLVHDEETAAVAPHMPPESAGAAEPSSTSEPAPPPAVPAAATGPWASAAEPPPAPPPPSLSGPELFAAANRARVAGDMALAVRLSRELEERFPTSPEAVTTQLSLGLIYLQQGAASDALLEFRRYRAVGAPSTIPEALWGEGRALGKLGRSDEERRVLEELLDRYPGSVYVAAARRRLAELH